MKTTRPSADIPPITL